MRPRTTAFMALLIVVVVGGALAIGLSGGRGSADTCAKSSRHATVTEVVVEQDKATPGRLTAHMCEQLKITNEDNVSREIAFGDHEKHVPYDGVAERVLNKGQSLTVTLNKLGTYHFHDHLHDEVEGFFTVTK